jgi:hypothetical protein
VNVLGVHGGASWVLVKLSSGVVQLPLFSLGIVLSGRGLVNDTALRVEEASRGCVDGLAASGHFLYYLSTNLTRGHGPKHGIDHSTLASLGTGGAAATGHDTHGGQTHTRARAHHVLPGPANWALGHGAEHSHQGTSLDTGIGTALLASVGAAATSGLGTDRGGHARLGVGQSTHGTTWALDVRSLGVVRHTLVSLDDVLALRSHHNDSMFFVHEFRRSFGDGGTTTSHNWYFLPRFF